MTGAALPVWAVLSRAVGYYQHEDTHAALTEAAAATAAALPGARQRATAPSGTQDPWGRGRQVWTARGSAHGGGARGE